MIRIIDYLKKTKKKQKLNCFDALSTSAQSDLWFIFLRLFGIYFAYGVFVCFMNAFECKPTCVECCSIATRRSWMRRISSRPVLMCSGFSSRTQDAKSVHCNSVSSVECKNIQRFKYLHYGYLINQIFVLI